MPMVCLHFLREGTHSEEPWLFLKQMDVRIEFVPSVRSKKSYLGQDSFYFLLQT